jgi:uncharacterized iron-regulated membrane protein
MVALYVMLTGVTGAALVFRPELQKLTFPEFFEVARNGQPDAPAAVIVGELQRGFPGYQLVGIDYPTYRRGTYLSYLIKGSELRTVFLHPVSGRVIGELPKTSWIARLQDLHADLLGAGRAINGIFAVVVIVVLLSGLLLMWSPRLKITIRGLHNAVGFWLIAILIMWAVSGVYFAFRAPFRKAVNAVSPLSVMRTPQSKLRDGRLPAADVSALIATSLALVPGAKMGRIVLPSSPRGSILILTAYKTHGDFDTSDEVTLYFDQYTGELLERRDAGAQKHSAGDLFLTWLAALHVGSFGGWMVKIAWFVLALSFPALAITGVVMWWNRARRIRP